MDKNKIKNIFDEYFKFKVGQEVRHKGDKKNGYTSNDMGMLIIKRNLEEEISEEEEPRFSRSYVCRLIKFSGSGDLALFRETELCTIEEHQRDSVLKEMERDRIRLEMKDIEKEIFQSFGVIRFQEVHIVNNGVVDKDNLYKVSGFRMEKNAYELSLRHVKGNKKVSDNIYVKSKEDLVTASVYSIS